MGIKKNYLIVKNNDLVESRYKLSLQEQKLILVLTSKIKKEDTELKKYQFYVSELADFLGLKKDGYYTELKKITEKLITRSLKIKEPDGLLQISFLSSAKYFKNKGKVELSFDEKLKPYLLQIKNNFTKYQLKNIVQLNSVYAIRIYELCKQYENTDQKERIIELEELKAILGIEKGKHKLYGHFKKYVLEIAKREINAKTDIEMDFEGIKTVRKITDVKFTIKRKEKENLQDFQRIENFEEVEKIKKINYSKEVVTLFEKIKENEQIESLKKIIAKELKEYPYEVVESNIYYANTRSSTNYSIYLKNAIQGDYAVSEREKMEINNEKKARLEEIEKEEQIKELKKEEERKKMEMEYEKLNEEYEKKSEKEKEEIYNFALDLMQKDGHNMFNKKVLQIMFNTAYKYKAMKKKELKKK